MRSIRRECDALSCMGLDSQGQRPQEREPLVKQKGKSRCKVVSGELACTCLHLLAIRRKWLCSRVNVLICGLVIYGFVISCRDKGGRRPVELATKDSVIRVLTQALQSSQVRSCCWRGVFVGPTLAANAPSLWRSPESEGCAKGRIQR